METTEFGFVMNWKLIKERKQRVGINIDFKWKEKSIVGDPGHTLGHVFKYIH